MTISGPGPGKPRPVQLHVNNDYVPRRGDLLPDGHNEPPREVYLQSTSDGRMLLRFSATVTNIGAGPLEIDTSSPTRQWIRNSDGGERSIPMKGQWVADMHPEHSHTHLADFQDFELRQLDEQGGVGPLVGRNSKVSFLVSDTEQRHLDMDPDGAMRVTRDQNMSFGLSGKSGFTSRGRQGISRGWSDEYGAGITGQAIDVTQAVNGAMYLYLRQTFDRNDRLAESNEYNNARDTTIRITSEQLEQARSKPGDAVPVDILGSKLAPLSAQPPQVAQRDLSGAAAADHVHDVAAHLGTTKDTVLQRAWALRGALADYKVIPETEQQLLQLVAIAEQTSASNDTIRDAVVTLSREPRLDSQLRVRFVGVTLATNTPPSELLRWWQQARAEYPTSGPSAMSNEAVLQLFVNTADASKTGSVARAHGHNARPHRHSAAVDPR